MNNLTFKDGEFPSGRRDFFFILACGLFLANFAGWSSSLTIIPNLVGLSLLFMTWVLALRSKNVNLKQFYAIWWLGLACLLSAQVLAVYLGLDAETG